jgi:hypothetical protein
MPNKKSVEENNVLVVLINYHVVKNHGLKIVYLSHRREFDELNVVDNDDILPEGPSTFTWIFIRILDIK